jgi:hypothetical protein
MTPPILKNNLRKSMQLKMKRIRPSNALKSRHNNSYSDAGVNWFSIFLELNQSKNKKETLHRLHPLIKYDACIKRFRQWRAANIVLNSANTLLSLVGSPSVPYSVNGTEDNRGGHNACMSSEEEDLCATFIITEYVAKNRPINRTDLRKLVKQYYYEQLHPQTTRNVRNFKVGDSFIDRFMKKNRMYCSSGRIIRQPQINDKTSLVAQHYLAQCARGYRQYGPSRVFTMDETFWPLVAKQQSLIRVSGRKVTLTHSLVHSLILTPLSCLLSLVHSFSEQN